MQQHDKSSFWPLTLQQAARRLVSEGRQWPDNDPSPLALCCMTHRHDISTTLQETSDLAGGATEANVDPMVEQSVWPVELIMKPVNSWNTGKTSRSSLLKPHYVCDWPQRNTGNTENQCKARISIFVTWYSNTESCCYMCKEGFKQQHKDMNKIINLALCK